MLDPSNMMSVSLRPSVARVFRDFEGTMSRASVPSDDVETRCLLLGWATASLARVFWGLRENKARG
jgi:hypothetical protein